MAVDRAEGALRVDEPQRILGPATVAVNISRRTLLSGIEGEWADSQRRRLERIRLRGLDCLSKMWLAKGESDLAVETATEAIELDGFRESSYQLLMQAHVQAGNPANAFYAYHRLRRLLNDELGTTPSPTIRGTTRGSAVAGCLLRKCNRHPSLTMVRQAHHERKPDHTPWMGVTVRSP